MPDTDQVGTKHCAICSYFAIDDILTATERRQA